MTQSTKEFPRPDFTDRRTADRLAADKLTAEAEELRARAGVWRVVRFILWLAVWIVMAPLLLAGLLGVGALVGGQIRGGS